MQENFKGALLMIGAMIGFTANDAIIKAVGSDVPLFQMLFLRGIPCTALLVVIAWRLGALKVNAPKLDWALVGLRSVMEVGASYFFIYALLRMDFANVTAILQALPLTVALSAAVIFGERLGWRRLLAILIGFAGVMLIVRPGPDGFTTQSIYALLAVALVTVRDLAARRMSQEMPSVIGAVGAAALLTICSGLAGFQETWVTPDVIDLTLINFAAVSVGIAYIFSVMAMRTGEITFIAPFRYTSFLVSLVLGLVFFDEWPDVLTLLGALVVVSMGLFTIYRERAAQRQVQSAKTLRR